MPQMKLLMQTLKGYQRGVWIFCVFRRQLSRVSRPSRVLGTALTSEQVMSFQHHRMSSRFWRSHKQGQPLFLLRNCLENWAAMSFQAIRKGSSKTRTARDNLWGPTLPLCMIQMETMLVAIGKPTFSWRICPGSNLVAPSDFPRIFSSDDLQGTGYTCFPNLSPPLGNLSLGICMDLNPLPDSIEWPAPCELASFALSKRSRILVILCAWLDSGAQPDGKWDLSTIEFWRERLLPLWSTDSPELRPMHAYPVPSDHDQTVVVICNRTGSERGTPVISTTSHPLTVGTGSTFMGCSLVARCSRTQGTFDIVGILDKTFEGFASWVVE
jgi:hypothetical protein